MVQDVLHVAVEHVCSQLFVPLDGDRVTQAFLFLLPEEGYATSDLDKAVEIHVVCQNELALHKIGHIWLVINASRDKSRTRSSMSPSRNQHDVYLLTLKSLYFLFDIALNDWNRPERVNVLQYEILNYLAVPEVPLVLEFFPELVGAICQADICFELHWGLALLAWGEVCVVAVVEALGRQ